MQLLCITGISPRYNEPVPSFCTRYWMSWNVFRCFTAFRSSTKRRRFFIIVIGLKVEQSPYIAFAGVSWEMEKLLEAPRMTQLIHWRRAQINCMKKDLLLASTATFLINKLNKTSRSWNFSLTQQHGNLHNCWDLLENLSVMSKMILKLLIEWVY